MVAINGMRSDQGRDGRRDGRRGGGRADGGRRFDSEGTGQRGGDYRDGRGRRGGHRGGHGQHYSGYSSPYGHGIYDHRPDFRNRYGFNYYGYYRGGPYSPGYRHYSYRGYRRVYGYESDYYRPYYYPLYYDNYPSVIVYDRAPVYQEVEVVYTDPVVTQRQYVTEGYTSPQSGAAPPMYVDPGSYDTIGTMRRVEPGTNETVLTDPQAAGVVESAENAAGGELSEAPALVEKGNEALRAGRYEEARGWHARAMLADEGDGFAKLFYAMSNLGLKEYGVAASAMRRALMDAPELIDYPIDLRTVYADASVLTTQIQELARARVAGSPDTDLTFLVGYLYYATGDPQGAIDTLSELTTGASDDTLARLVRDAAIRVQSGPEEVSPPVSVESNKT